MQGRSRKDRAELPPVGDLEPAEVRSISLRAHSPVLCSQFILFFVIPRIDLTGLDSDRLLGKRFEERQELYEQRKKERRQAKEQKCCTFHPEINFTSEILVEADPKRSGETETERIARMSRRDEMRQQRIRQEMDAELNSKCTHRPKINEVSRSMARNYSVDDIASVERLKTNRAKMVEQAQVKEKEECTFHPQINSQVQANSHYTRDANIMEMIKEREREREEKRQQQRRDYEYEEIKGCTFQPAITQLERPPEAAVVKGSLLDLR